jgi:hypothetical protein
MHRFRTKSTITRFRLISLLICLRLLMTIAALWIALLAVVRSDYPLALTAAGIGVATILTMVIQWLVAARCRCPLCQTPVLASRRCSKHRNARALLGSYRLRIALAVLFKGSFRCPYCDETTAMEVRANRR